MNGNGNKARILREISAEDDQFLTILKSVKFGQVEKIEMREGAIRRFRLSYDINLDDLDDVMKKLEELKSIPLD